MTLPADLQAPWEAYLAEERSGVRSVALGKLHGFIEKLNLLPQTDRHAWAMEVIQTLGERKTPVRFPLFQAVLFPALFIELESGSGAAARMLAGFSQLLHECGECRAKLPEHMRTEHGLILEAVRRDRSDLAARLRLREIFRDRFRYALHELPAGVLYGYDGATPEQCDELMDELQDYERLCAEIGAEDSDTGLMQDSRFHILAYKDFIKNRNSQDSFADYLDSHR